MLAGVLGYFLVTYLFYLVMAMYNMLFLIYVILLGASFFAFLLILFSFNVSELTHHFEDVIPRKFTGSFLIFNSMLIGLMWLGVVVRPLFDGSVIPPEVEHYTTLIVQGLDLALLLPASYISGWLFYRQKPMGYLLAPIYVIFLSILMAALTAKIVAMGWLGQPVIPAIVIIPLLGFTALYCAVSIVRNITKPAHV
jgi:hypothetical protein